jgi:hypothetical protein
VASTLCLAMILVGPTPTGEQTGASDWGVEAYEHAMDDLLPISAPGKTHLFIQRLDWAVRFRVRASVTEIREPQSTDREVGVSLEKQHSGEVRLTFVSLTDAPLAVQLAAFHQHNRSASPESALSAVRATRRDISVADSAGLPAIIAELESMQVSPLPSSSQDSARARVYDFCAYSAANHQCLTWRQVRGSPLPGEPAPVPHPLVAWMDRLVAAAQEAKR